ncbi:MAG: PKD domain-containing protein [Bacteroidota bacterium]
MFEIQRADFSVSTDTLYLDNPTTNIIQFTDLSIDPVSWLWNFGEGSSSTIQNPAFSYNQPGTYTISLTIENIQGCIDTRERTLVVANRPTDPTFEDFLICPGTTVVLSHENASTLKVFVNESQTTPETEGNTVEIGPFEKDSIIYVSATFGGFESSRVSVNISVYDEIVDFSIAPDTLSEAHQFIATANVESTSTINWFIDGTSAGTDEQLSVPANLGQTNIRLAVTTANSCIVEKEVDLLVNSSPTPSTENLAGCLGESLTLKPENGTYFGFYEDVELTTLISKGTQLEVQESQTVFVVGLDDGLPSDPVEVNLSLEEFAFDIEYSASIIGDKNKVDLTTSSNQEIVSYQWYVNDELTETSSSPSLFFDNEIIEVVLEATSSIGCLSYDTLQLDFTPPLGISETGSISIHPNPTDGIVSISSAKSVHTINVINISGKQAWSLTSPNETINLSTLSDGIYILEFELSDGTERLKVLKGQKQ